MPAILFGSISTLVDTSELQREAFNQAFEEHDLGWRWDRDDYQALLERSGGKQRIADQAKARDQAVDADAVHQTKSEIFRRRLAEGGLPSRPGVAETIRQARSAGLKVGLVTTTSPANVEAVLEAIGPELARDAFDVVVDATSVDAAKPDGAAYRFALDQLDEAADACVAIEDNLGGVAAADAAGIPCVAFPNANTSGHDFGAGHERVDQLSLVSLRSLTSS